jgi:SulP family sulfate permease
LRRERRAGVSGRGGLPSLKTGAQNTGNSCRIECLAGSFYGKIKTTTTDRLDVLQNRFHRFTHRIKLLADRPLMRRYLPISSSLAHYDSKDFSGDVTAGIIVAIMLIPQSMAYALLAGLPPQSGLYASMLPLLAYALFGTSRALAVGPVAIVSLMVASTLAPLAELGSEQYVTYAIMLALLSGLFLIVLGILRIGFLVNFMSHPVIAGFTSAAALIIGFSQFKHLLGISIHRTHLVPSILWQAYEQASRINLVTVLLAAFSITLLLARDRVTRVLYDRGWISQKAAKILPRAMPLVLVTVTVFVTWIFNLSENFDVKIVGAVPSGLPPFKTPHIDIAVVIELLPAAVLISIVGFLESVSVAKSLASKRRQKIIANQELIGLGAANIGAALTGAYPVTGGFSRSVVNFNAGARTQLASVFTAVLIAVVLIFFTPLLHFLPKAVLASIIIVAIGTLVDFSAFTHAWAYNKADGFSFLITFFAVLGFGVEIGILLGIGVSLGLYLYRTSKPHVALVGRVGQSEHFRNVLRHDVRVYEKLVLLRVDESLYFANMAALEEKILRHIVDHPQVDNLVLICSAVNAIDASALDSIDQLIIRMKDAGVQLHLAEVKGPVMDKLQKVGFPNRLSPGQIFISTHEAVDGLCT